MKEGVIETYSPVCAWTSVRMFLVLSIIFGWITVSLDFSNAFVQALLKRPVWIHIPRGYRSSQGHSTILRLIKSLYGLADAPKMWSDHLRETLLDMGFVPSAFDPCLLLRKDMMIVVYVDDCGVAAKTQAEIDAFIAELRKRGFALTVEGSFSEFLGIKFSKLPDGSIEMTQQGLIDKIVETTGLQNSKPNSLPAAQQALGADPEGAPMDEKWSYSSVVGMLLYLSTNTRVDIAFAVSQVCRFSSAPKQSHARAVKSIVRYLHGTRHKGMIIRPSARLNFHLYVDADFAGLFRSEVDHSPDAARSRTGYVLMLSNCPLIWKSCLQSSIAASTCEAEYTALSSALKVLLPLKRMLQEITSALCLPDPICSTIRATVFEDNQSALYLATNQRITNRTRYFLVKWHWFWQYYPKEFDAEKIGTHDQRADYLTKALPRDAFEKNRMHVQGW